MTAGLPSLPPEWGIDSARQIADTVVGTVFEVTRGSNEADILKVLKPKALEDSLRGADFLDWRDGVGCVRLIARRNNLLLMEHAGAVTLRERIASHGDRDATMIAAEVLNAYHGSSPRQPPPSLQSLDRYFTSLFRKAKEDARFSIYKEAADTAQSLIADQRDVKPLHGDLHHENIMLSPRGWIVIDPAGLIGDAALDVANMFSNPLDRFDLTRDQERIAWMAEVFADALGRDVRTILRYAFAYGCLSAAWHEEDENGAERDNELAVVDAVKAVLSQV